tara:strand:+ start:557 stop:1321 length:765 start_codon:yes stop_codon:yes gene_type:complete
MIRKFTINGTEVEISFNAKTHRYTITINGVKNHSPSVSTILKMGDTFGIASAAGRKNYQDTLHEVLCVGEGTEFRDKDELLEKLILIKKEAANKWLQSATLGTLCHEFWENIPKGIIQYDEDKKIQRLQYALYNYHLKNVTKTNYTERLVYNDNLGTPYAGMFDADLEIRGERVLMDLKTYTKKSNTSTWPIQLSAYNHAHTLELGIEPLPRVIIAIDKDTEEVKEFWYRDSQEKHLEVFKSYLHISQFLKEKN